MPSTVISHFTYDPVKSILRVIFLSGSVYDYKNVPKEVYDEMKRSGSKGTYLNQRIKGHYPFVKVPNPTKR
jgi:hypothetical protein